MPGQPGGRPVSPHEDLRSLLQRYARAVDERDLDILGSLFHPEAEISGAGGGKNLEDWLDTMRGPRVFPHSMHVFSDPLIELDEGDQGAQLDTYAVVYQLSDPTTGQADLTLGIRYLDRAETYRGSWVFRRREARTLWMR
jgi:hypothetical protein